MILLLSLFYFLSFSFPNLFCLFVFFDSIKIFTKNNIFKESLFFSLKESAIPTLFLLPLSIWSYFYLKCSVFIFFYFIIAILFIGLISFIFQYVLLKIYLKIHKKYYPKNILINIFIQKLFYVFFRYILYVSIGNLYSKDCICPFYFTLTPIAYYSYLLPFSIYFNPWIYSTIYFFIINILKNFLKEYFFYLIIFLSLFNYIFLDNNKKFYFENNFDKNNIEEFIQKNTNKNIVIIPEGSLKIKKYEDIEKIKYYSKKHDVDIIFGCKIYINNEKKEKIVSRNAAILVLKNGKIFIHKKKHCLPFTENLNGKRKIYKEKENLLECPYYIKICSEFFLSPIAKIKNNEKPIIVISSMKWTDNLLASNYKNILKCIYKIHRSFDKLVF
jgi:hypothetical protein